MNISSTGKRMPADRSIRIALLFCALFAMIINFFVLIFLLKEGYPIFQTVGAWELISGGYWGPTQVPPSYGAFPLIAGTLLVTLGAMIIAVPLGLASAIFISQIAPGRLRIWMKTSVEVLAGIPSVVYGFFGLMVLTNWLRITFHQPSGECWLAGSIILAIMALPTIISVAEDAISSVPIDYRDASLALGATRWQTISRVIVPAALSGITAAIILGIGRVVGETMAVMMVTGNASILPQPITNVFSPIRTITGTLAIEMGEVASGSMHYHALFGLAIILLLISFLINISASIIITRIKQRRVPVTEACKLNAPRRSCYSPKLSVNFRRYIRCGVIMMILLLVAFWIGMIQAIVLVILLLGLWLVNKRISRKSSQRIAFGMMTAAMMVVIFMLGVILYYIIANGVGALTPEFLSQFPRDNGRSGGIFPAIVGTLYLAGGAIVIATPIGVCAAIYLTEYQREGSIIRVIRAGVDVLNGTPSIVFGLFGFSFLVLYLKMGISLAAGQITLALMILPTIIRTTEEAIKSVPQSLREGSLALGATKWQTVRKVVIPSAAPGILTGVVLSIGRAMGETAPIMFTAVVFTQRYLPSSLSDPVMALPYHLFALVTTIPGSSQNAYGTALVLLLLVIAIYSVAIVLRRRYNRLAG